MRQVACLCLLLALAVSVNAGPVSPNRKMLTVNGQQAAQAPQNTQQYGYGRGYNDQGYAQLAANERAIVNTQYAIQDAVNSGANPYVTDAAARYGNFNAYAATQANRCGWYNRVWFGPCLGKK